MDISPRVEISLPINRGDRTSIAGCQIELETSSVPHMINDKYATADDDLQRM